MLDAALPILSRDEDASSLSWKKKGPITSAITNGRGVVEAAVRADEAIGVALDVETERPNTC